MVGEGGSTGEKENAGWTTVAVAVLEYVCSTQPKYHSHGRLETHTTMPPLHAKATHSYVHTYVVHSGSAATVAGTQHGTHLGNAKGSRFYCGIDGRNTQQVPHLAGCHMHGSGSGVPAHESAREEQCDEAELKEAHGNLVRRGQGLVRRLVVHTVHGIIHTGGYADTST